MRPRKTGVGLTARRVRLMGSTFEIAVLAGDGIGAEVTPSALVVASEAMAAAGGPKLVLNAQPAGAAHFQHTGSALPEETLRACEAADAIYLGAMGLPDVRYPDGTEITPQIALRIHFDLYAGLRPTRAIPGVPAALADPEAGRIDFALVRESTEGLFASYGKGEVEGDRARDTQVITRDATLRVSRFAFDLAVQRGARGDGASGAAVTLVDKANVFASFAFMRRVFDEVAAGYPAVTPHHLYVDAAALAFVTKPWTFDVIVTENMFGDILSDLAAGLVGGMGYAPSADIGDRHAVFQPAHGSAPDIMGTGRANPTAAILSAALMLDWLGQRHGMTAATDAAMLINRAVDAAFADGGLRTAEHGGSAGVREVTDHVLDHLRQSTTPSVSTPAAPPLL